MTSRNIHLLALGLFLCGTIAAVGDKLVSIPGVPPIVAQCWPFIFAAAGIADKVLHILYAPSIAQAQAVLAQTAATVAPPILDKPPIKP